MVSTGGHITPLSAELLEGGTVHFSLSSDEGYSLSHITGCDGILNGDQYTVESPQSDCSIAVSFVENIYTVDTNISDGGSTDKPSTEVSYGVGIDLMIAPHTDHEINNVTGCQGQLTGSLYSTGQIFQDCTVDIRFSPLMPEPAPPLTQIRIPVVVHVFDSGPFELTNEKIISQIEVTNKHFRQYNLDELETLPEEDKPYVADTGIQFYLADRDPQGEPHNGIVRLNAGMSGFDLEYNFAQSELGGSDPWPNDHIY